LYDDVDASRECILSVLEQVDLSVNRLLIVNDCGPNADDMGKMALSAISGIDSAEYHRNERNLGFVGTCNRAVLELDHSGNDVLLLNSDARLTPGAVEELGQVMALDEKHGAVFPRSNNATIASVPLLPLTGTAVEEGFSSDVYSRLKKELPRFSITPTAVGFCLLIRRQVIDNYGLFDPIYGRGYSEENDFCLRINRFGYSAVLAHQAYVFHHGSRSFGDGERAQLQRRNESLMTNRYGFYPDSVRHYFRFIVDPVDWFSDRLYGGGKPRVLIDIFQMSLIYNGSTRNALSFLDLLTKSMPDNIEFVVSSSREAIDFFHLERFGFRLVVNGELNETFDLGFALAPVSSAVQIRLLNRHCLRWVVSHFDIIALRIQSLLEVDFSRRQVVLDALRYADRVIPISEASLVDLENYFGQSAHEVREKSTVIHEGVADTSLDSKDGSSRLSPEVAATVEKGGYVLVIGNIFSHKQLPEAIKALRGGGRQIVGFGALNDPAMAEGVLFVEGGLLSDDDVDTLYRRAGCVVFPSSYEGFGLPMAEAGGAGRPVVVFDSDVAREVAKSLHIQDLVHYFSRFSELGSTVDTALSAGAGTAQQARNLRPLETYNQGIMDVLTAELARPVDVARLRERTAYFRSVGTYSESVEKQLSTVLARASYRALLVALHRLRLLLPLGLRVVGTMRHVRNSRTRRAV
jgi:GT2 family glycosyltransferase